MSPFGFSSLLYSIIIIHWYVFELNIRSSFGYKNTIAKCDSSTWIENIVLRKYQEEGLPINDLLIADEVMALHYENKVGLVPLSKTAHEIIHNSTKLFVPINMCYGNYSEFLNEYEPYIEDEVFEKIERKVLQTKNLTPESFEAITKEFKYLEVEGVKDIEKMELAEAVEIA